MNHTLLTWPDAPFNVASGSPTEPQPEPTDDSIWATAENQFYFTQPGELWQIN